MKRRYYRHDLIILAQVYQTEVLFRSHDQMGHQGINKVTTKNITQVRSARVEKGSRKVGERMLVVLASKRP